MKIHRTAALLLAVSSPAYAQFVEPDVSVVHTFTGDTAGETFGYAVSELADIDDDGADDVIVGAPFASDEIPFAGRLYVYSGRTGELIYRLNGLAPADQLGWSLADGGDIDRDGVHDILGGAPGAGPGHVYIFSGRTGALIGTVAGDTPGDYFGFSVGALGDVNGDHRPEFVVGAGRALGPAGALQGKAYVISGKDNSRLRVINGENAGAFFGSGIAGTGDVDGDGRGDFIVGARNAGPTGAGRSYLYSGRTGNLIFQPFNPGPTGADMGWFFVAGVGDVDGDGRRDLYSADVSDFSEGPGTGRAYVYSGRDGHTLYEFPGSQGDGTGCGRGARDVDGDLHSDLIVGSYTSGEGAPYGGKATVYSGCNGSVLRTFTSTSVGETFGYDAVGLGDVNGDREADFLVSAATVDTVYVVAGAKTCVADFDHDGDVDRADKIAFVLAALLHRPNADTNCDGRIDLADTIVYLRAVLLGCG